MYFLREALRNFYRHRRVNVVAVFVIAAGMLLVSGVALAYMNFRNFAAYWGSQVHMVIYLRDDLTPERLEALHLALNQAPETASMTYTSKDQALQQLRSRLGEGANILEGLQTNPLPASFTVTIRDEFRRPELLRESVERYRQLPEIEDIDYGERWLERFHSLVWTLEIGVIGIGGIMGVAVMFIIATTVRLALYTRAEEIEIMQLVGATLWFIKFPFFLEGVLQGVLGASLAVGLCYGLFSSLLTWIRPMGELLIDFSLLQFLPLPVIASILLAGAVLGGLGSLFSLRQTTTPA
ncbi:MAG TPA: permease-like cell division protein FtsX [Candidatus Tectomicrobia bacterium]|nr:permease-like cell division protein FtsX [Candidatus Tectomicrobia bacterium]